MHIELANTCATNTQLWALETMAHTITANTHSACVMSCEHSVEPGGADIPAFVSVMIKCSAIFTDHLAEQLAININNNFSKVQTVMNCLYSFEH